LVWADEFDTPGLPDPTRWDYDTERNSLGWYNNELQYYARDRAENARVEDGNLIITARKESLVSAPDWGGQAYTSARMVTRGKASWTYGLMEVRAKLPCGLGTWPAIWMLGAGGHWPDDGEIDIMEQLGRDPQLIYGTIHNLASDAGGTVRLADACSAFHTYQLTWTADAIRIGVDGSDYFTYAKPRSATYAQWPFDQPQYLLLNIALGGWGGAVNNSIFPVQMRVDYVRVYQRSP
jgi:beta-glucanase (GH16 family)